MIRVILSGCGGYMGHVMTDLIAGEKDMGIVAGIDPFAAESGKSFPYPVFASLSECKEEADVLIDFSRASALEGLAKACAEKKLPAVLCATGYSEEQLSLIRETAETIPVLQSYNMSLGINLILKLLREAAKTLYPAGFDIEIVEKHHRRKLDAPSGTAIAMADSIRSALEEETGEELAFVYDRSGRHEQRPKAEIGLSAVRGGTLVGEHDVIFAGTDEVFTISHKAYSRAIFAKGAVAAAKFLVKQPAGLYDMSQVIEG